MTTGQGSAIFSQARNRSRRSSTSSSGALSSRSGLRPSLPIGDVPPGHVAAADAPQPSVTLAITLGDPRGIGPEVVSAALRVLRLRPRSPRIVIFGPGNCDAQLDAAEFHA